MVGQVTLSEAQAANNPKLLRYFNWIVAEFSVVITDLPEVIGIGIALNIFFGVPFYVGVLLSIVSTMLFLFTQGLASGLRIMEIAIVFFIGIMTVTLFVEQGMVGTQGSKYMEGWIYGFVNASNDDIFTITGIIGAVCMPHNLYLHTASVLSRPVVRDPMVVKKAAFWVALEPVFPIILTFFVNAAVVTIAAEQVFFNPNPPVDPDDVGISNFADVLTLKGGPTLFGLALLAAGQSSAVTTTYSGQYIMDGFLNIRLPLWGRAILTRCVAIVPCLIVAVTADGAALNTMVNIVNSSLSVLLPFALTPLVKLTTSKTYMGEYACGPIESVVVWFGAVAVYAVNAYAMSASGGGFFGDLIASVPTLVNVNGTTLEIDVQTPKTVQAGIFMDVCQIVYLVWNLYTALAPMKAKMRDVVDERRLEDEDFGVVRLLRRKAISNSCDDHLEPLLVKHDGGGSGVSETMVGASCA